jgi:hypothetical protein
LTEIHATWDPGRPKAAAAGRRDEDSKKILLFMQSQNLPDGDA